LQRACFYLVKSTRGIFSKELSLEEARHIGLSIVGCATGYGSLLRRRQSKLIPAPFLERRQKRLPSDSTWFDAMIFTLKRILHVANPVLEK
jgi:hypothetical protein